MKPNYRRCISCRQVNLKQEFWRIVRVFPSGKVQLDQGMGRSASCLLKLVLTTPGINLPPYCQTYPPPILILLPFYLLG